VPNAQMRGGKQAKEFKFSAFDAFVDAEEGVEVHLA